VDVIFLGTNGWYSTSTGNTACVFVDSADYYLVFDAGDGLAKLDQYITIDKPVYLFLSHFHLDHIIGFHALSKFKLKQEINIYGQKGTEKILNSFVNRPFTVSFSELPFKTSIKELTEGTHNIPFPVTCRFLLHSDPCLGYRINVDGKTIAYCTDTGICENSLKLAQNADILIHECAAKTGQHNEKWPHTSPTEAAQLAVKAQVKQLVLFHFDASIYHSIEDRKRAEMEARQTFGNTVAAVDGVTITL
jgi:ribonuclease BN (tRNA processing enzyme)